MPPAPSATRFRCLYQTGVAERAVDFLAPLYGRHALRLSEPEGLRMQVHGFEFGRMHVGAIRYGAEVVADVSPRHPGWVFSFLRHGQVRRGRAGVLYGRGDAAVLMPGEGHEIRMSADMEIVNLRVPADQVRRAWWALTGDTEACDPTLAPRVDAGMAAAGVLERVVDYMARTPVYDADGWQHLEHHIQDAAVCELLLAWPGTARQHGSSTDEPRGPGRPAGRGSSSTPIWRRRRPWPTSHATAGSACGRCPRGSSATWARHRCGT